MSSIRFSIPCNHSNEEQTTSSFRIRTLVGGLGGISLVIGILLLRKILTFQNCNSTYCGASFTTAGGLALLIAFCVRSVKDSEANPTGVTVSNANLSISNSQMQEKPPSPKIVIGGTKDLKKISDNTMELMHQGFCQSKNGNCIPFSSAEVLSQNSSLHKYDQVFQLVVSKDHQQRVSVIETDSLDAAEQLVKERHKVAVLNFAGSESAGGGFLEGTGGQEERLIYRCDLANLMQHYYDKQFQANCPEYPLYDHLIHTPDVTVFRRSDFTVVDDPFQIGVLTSAAPVSKLFSPGALHAFDIVITSESVDYALAETGLYMKHIIYTQLKTAYEKGYDAIVLGAFGCGAFRNPPEQVAKLYREVIETYFQNAFKEIIFAILDAPPQRHNPHGNLKPFQDQLIKIMDQS